jgi:hypothetical protein
MNDKVQWAGLEAYTQLNMLLLCACVVLKIDYTPEKGQ